MLGIQRKYDNLLNPVISFYFLSKAPDSLLTSFWFCSQLELQSHKTVTAANFHKFDFFNFKYNHYFICIIIKYSLHVKCDILNSTLFFTTTAIRLTPYKIMT